MNPSKPQVAFFSSLRFKIGFGYIVLVAINVGVTVYAIYSFNQLTQSLDVLQSENYQNIISVENMARAVERHAHAVADVLNRDPNNGKIEFIRANDDFRAALASANKRNSTPDAVEILKNIDSLYGVYTGLADSINMLAAKDEYTEARAYRYNAVTPALQKLRDNCFWLIEQTQQEIMHVRESTKQLTDQSILALGGASMIALVLSVLAGLQFTRRIILPAERLTSTVRQIGSGRLDLKADVDTRDEIGELSREFNKMTERLRRFEAMNIERVLLEQRKSETIVGNILDAIIVCDASGIVQLINHGGEKVLNVQERDALGKPIGKVTSDERIVAFFTRPGDFVEGTQHYMELTAGGRKAYFHPLVSLLRSTSGEPEGAVLVLQDVSQYKELDRQKSEFMATVSHEFRTPLTSINLGVDILRQHLLGPLTKPQEEMIEAFKQDCVRLTKLVRELLQLSKLESGAFVRREEPVEIRTVIEGALEPLRLQFREKHVELCVDVPAHLPMIVGDEQHLSWVISNLVSNALKYTPGGGKVEIEVFGGEEKDLLVRVRDSGEGIPPEYIDKIFDKFVQVKQSMDTTPGSVGLGLAIAKDVVEMYGGKIWVESSSKKGSTFYVRLPAARETLQAAGGKAETHST